MEAPYAGYILSHPMMKGYTPRAGFMGHDRRTYSTLDYAAEERRVREIELEPFKKADDDVLWMAPYKRREKL